MVAFEKAAKVVLGLGSPDPAFIARGEQNFVRFAAVLDKHLRNRTWLVGARPTIADFSIGAFVPSAVRFGLPVAKFDEIRRWYDGLAALPAWRDAVDSQSTATTAWLAANQVKASAVKAYPHSISDSSGPAASLVAKAITSELFEPIDVQPRNKNR